MIGTWKQPPLVLFPVNPSTLVNYRKGFRPSGAKSDPSDATLLVDLLIHHRERLRQLRPDSEQTRTLHFLVEGRRKFVHEKVRYSNRLTAYLKMYTFPQVLDWFSAVGSPIVGDFLLRWPTLEKLQKARPDTLRKFFRKHNSCQSDSLRADKGPARRHAHVILSPRCGGSEVLLISWRRLDYGCDSGGLRQQGRGKWRQAAGGLSRQAFCNTHGLSLSTLNRHRKRQQMLSEPARQVAG